MYLPALFHKTKLRKWFFYYFTSSLLLFVVFLVLPQTIHAQEKVSYDTTTNRTMYVQHTFYDVLSLGICQLTGYDYVYQRPCLTIDPSTKQLTYNQNQKTGAINLMISMMASTYTPPAHTLDYIAYVHNTFGLTGPVYAQEEGSGFKGFTPIIRIWSLFRNISYLFFILAFALIGLAIMLRVKIDPRTVMTIQNQIPKIVVSIVLITFSYAIAGMLIDIMYVSSYMLMNVFANPAVTSAQVHDQITKPNGARDAYYSQNPLGFTNELFDGGLGGLILSTAGGVKDIVGGALSDALGAKQRTGNILQQIFDVIIGGILTGLGNLVSFFIGFAAIFIVAIAVFIALFRLWFILIKAYLFILIDVAIAPLWIAAGLIPGSTVNFTSWFRHLAAHVIVFPATLALFLLCIAFQDSFGQFAKESNQATQQVYYFHAPLTGNLRDVSGFGAIIAFGFLLLAPTLLDQMRDILKAQPSKYSAEIGRGFSRGSAPVGLALGAVRGEVFRRSNTGEALGPGALGAKQLWNRVRYAGRPNERQRALEATEKRAQSIGASSWIPFGTKFLQGRRNRGGNNQEGQGGTPPPISS